MNRINPVLAFTTAILLTGGSCDINVSAPDMVGEWGGEHILLLVAEGGGALEYDCAHGSFQGPIEPDRGGNFEVSGVHVPEHGGPVQEGEVLEEYSAVYRGWTNGRRMTLTVTLSDTDETVGTYSLRLGEPAQLFKCL